MAKTKDISTLESIPANSAAVLAKTKDGKVGYIVDLFTEEGKIAQVPDHKDFATHQDVADAKAEVTDEIVAVKTEVAGKVTRELVGTNNGDKAKIQNQTDGGVMQYVKADGSNSAVCVSDGTSNVGAEICSLNPQNEGARILVNEEGAYYSVGSTIDTAEGKEIAVKDDIAKKIDITIQSTNGDIAYMNNEANGGLIKFTKQDGTFSKVTLFDGSDNAKTMLQLVVKDGTDATKVAKLNGTVNGLFYVKEADNTPKPEKEIATKGDLQPYSPAELVGLEEGHKATCHNSADGGSLKYETPTQTAFIGVNCDSDSNKLLAEFAVTEKKDGTTLKQGNRLLAKENGIFYTKSNNLDTPEDSEVATLADVNKKLDIESKGTVGQGVFTFTNGKAGATIKYADNNRKLSGVVGVFDGNTNGILAEIGAGPAQLNKGPRIFLNTEKAVYCKGKLVVNDEDEILTKKDITELTAKVTSLETESDSLEARVESMETTAEKLEEALKKVEGLEAQLKANQAEMAELQANYAAAVKEVNSYTANVKQLIQQGQGS